MKFREYLMLCLIAALVFLRCTGVHLHAHNHSAPHEDTIPEGIHLAGDHEHSGPHTQDIDLNFLNAALTKLPDFDQPLLPALFVLLLIVTVRRSRRCRSLPDIPAWITPFLIHPPSRAPPR